jgi:hypothetical protein
MICSSETKHDRTTAPRPKLFVSASRLQEQRPQHRKTVMGSSPDEDDFYSSETKHDRRTALRQNLFVSARRLQELRSQTRKLPWVRVSMKMLGLGIIINVSVIFNDKYRMIRTIRSSRAVNIDKCKYLLNFPTVTLREFC